MDDLSTLQISANESTRPAARNRILSARFSEEEYAALEKRAWAEGTTLGDWVRDGLLGELKESNSEPIQTHIFTELVAIELVIVNALEPLLRGEKLTQEQTARIFREVQATKAVRAEQILKKRMTPAKEA